MATAATRGPAASAPGFNEKMLFWASFFTLVAAGIGASVRGAVLKDWGDQFGFTQTELGAITGGGLFGFGITIIALSFVADWIGYGKLMLLAFALYVSSAVVTFAASIAYAKFGKQGAYWCLFIGAWLFSLANGTCETVINPLTATLFPRNKTHFLNILHAGWPGGLILGALIKLGLNRIDGIPWEVKLGVFLAPVLVFGIMMFNRPFPRSEAKVQGVSIQKMMGEIGFLGVAVVVFFLGILLTTIVIPAVASGDWLTTHKHEAWGIGWGTAAAVWVIYTVASGFKPGHLVLAFLYILHALVGYVELGTDSWIINIGTAVLNNPQDILKSAEDKALIAFIWTNLVMFSLRFFAGPIVHKISPLGLLFASALLGTAGLVLFSQPFVNSFVLWVVVSTIYAVGKTFYWPTLLGVISERFPKGGALALGFSGGVGMLSAGLLGAPGIGYWQDRLAVDQLQQTAPASYQRYEAKKEDGSPDKKGFPLLSDFAPDAVPPVAGLDNSKLKIMSDKGAALAADIKTMQAAEAKDPKAADAELHKSLTGLETWWDTQGKQHYDQDKAPLDKASLSGSQGALLYTAVVPAAMAIGFLLLVLVFKMQGGYTQVHLEETEGPAEY
jgi:MFS family permease